MDDGPSETNEIGPRKSPRLSATMDSPKILAIFAARNLSSDKRLGGSALFLQNSIVQTLVQTVRRVIHGTQAGRKNIRHGLVSKDMPHI